MPTATRRTLVLSVLTVSVAMADIPLAQERVLLGFVSDDRGAPVRDADIGIASMRRLVRSDSAGRFRVADIPSGRHEVSFRRLGFSPRTLFVHGDSLSDTLRVTLRTEALLLDAVNAHERRLRHGIEDFYRRRIKGVGTYWTREEIESRQTQRTSDILRGAPGIRFVRVSSGMGVRFNATSIVRRDCTPMIWMDGQRAPGLEVDDILARDIEGIELYGGPSTTPMQFSQYSSGSTCGTIVIWTRIPGP